MSELTTEEKVKVVEVALKYIAPILIKHDLMDEKSRQACIESFQAGIKFYHEESKKP